jgi:hypothetical protein
MVVQPVHPDDQVGVAVTRHPPVRKQHTDFLCGTLAVIKIRYAYATTKHVDI